MADPTGAPAAARAATEETSLDRATAVAVSPAPLALGSTNATTPGQASAVVISSEVTVASADSLYTPRPRSLSYGSVDAMAEDDRANPRPGGGSATPNEHDPSLTVESSGPLQQLDGLRSPLEEKKETLNHMFGMHKWKSHVSQRPLEERSAVVKELYKPPTKFRPRSRGESTVSVGNVLYSLLFGWWVALVYYVCGAIMFLTIVGQDYAFSCWDLAGYFFWPFGKSVARILGPPGEINNNARTGENLPLMQRHRSKPLSANELYANRELYRSQRFTGRHKPFAFTLWCILCVVPIAAVHISVFLACEFLVVLMPMAKVHLQALATVLWYAPTSVRVNRASPYSGPTLGTEVVMCVYEAINYFYYKYSFQGMNIVMVNLFAFVLATVFFGYIPVLEQSIGHMPIFVMALLSIIPLAYYIGMAISSISAQSSFGVGAVLNATFGSVVEMILYFTALRKGLVELVKASLTGSLLATMLFIPGLCMIIGGIKHKEQRFNWRSAGVGSSLLFVSVAGAYSPSVFQTVFGSHELSCLSCEDKYPNASFAANFTTQMVVDNVVKAVTVLVDGVPMECSHCSYKQSPLSTDVIYHAKTKYFVYVCAAVMPLVYIVGLVFTLRTHKHIYDKANTTSDAGEEAGGEAEGHSAPHWSRTQAAVVLVVSTVLMGLVAEVVVHNIQDVIEGSGISQVFIGVTLIAVVPDVAEIVTGVQFALRNQISLSIEVGSSIAVQICLLQMPVLVLLSEAFSLTDDTTRFTMCFNHLYVWAVLISVIVMNYVFMDGKSDYFQGATLFGVYIVFVSMFYFAPDHLAP